MKRSGFTLIELLVVIAIIAILAAILFPVFAQAKESAKKAACLAQTKQVTLAVLMYGNDYDDFIVPGQMQSDPGTKIGPDENGYNATVTGTATAGQLRNGTSFDVLLDPYIKNHKLWTCPAASNASLARSISMNPAAGGNFLNTNPTLNLGANAQPSVAPTVGIVVGQKLNGSSLQYPAEFILFGDAVAVQYGNVYNQMYTVTATAQAFGTANNFSSTTARNAYTPDSFGACLSWEHQNGGPTSALAVLSANDKIFTRHSNKTNLGFGDGHAKTLNASQTLFPFNMWFPERPNTTVDMLAAPGKAAAGSIGCYANDGVFTTPATLITTALSALTTVTGPNLSCDLIQFWNGRGGF